MALQLASTDEPGVLHSTNDKVATHSLILDTSDSDASYRRVILRIARLKQLAERDAPDVVLRNERRLVRAAVEDLLHGQASTVEPAQGSTDPGSLGGNDAAYGAPARA